MSESSPWSAAIRRMHMLLALTVSTQLVIGLSLDRDRPWLFEVHEWLGLAIAAIVLVFWGLAFKHRREGIHHMFPWSPQSLKAATRELGAALRGRLATGGPGGKLAGLIHGLGFLAATAMAASGSIIFVLIEQDQSRSAFAHTVKEFHETVATLLIIYWVGHVAMGIIHRLSGHSTVQDMWRV